MRSHGNSFLSRPQTAGGGSDGAQLSKPFPKPQLKPLKAVRSQGCHVSECSKHVPNLQCTLAERCETYFEMFSSERNTSLDVLLLIYCSHPDAYRLEDQAEQ